METVEESFSSSSSYYGYIQILAVMTYLTYLAFQIHGKSIVMTFTVAKHLLWVITVAYCGHHFHLGLTGVLLTLVCLWTMNRRHPRNHLPVANKAILVTGCDRGIGFNLAIYLDHLGFTVFAGCLSTKGEHQDVLVEQCSSRLHLFQMDVTDREQVQSCASYVRQEVKAKGLTFWGVVNNAGICYIGNVEMMCQDDIDKVMAVNYFGPVNVCKTFLPLLRRGKGRIVNIASNAGLAPVPLMGVYCASKAALSTMSEVWRYELRMWGISVSTVIPSGYNTGIIGYNKEVTGDRWWTAASEVVKQDFGRDCFHIKFKKSNINVSLSSDFTEIQNNIADALLSVSPKPCYYNGFLAWSLPFLYLHLPSCIGDPITKLLTDWFDFQPQNSVYHKRILKQA